MAPDVANGAPGEGDQSDGDDDNATDRPLFEVLARAWHRERYTELRAGGAERERDVEAILRLHLLPHFAGPVPRDPRQGRQRVLTFLRDKVEGRVELDPPTQAWLKAEGEYLSVREAAERAQCSTSAIRRRLRDQTLPGAYRDADHGRWLIPSEALRAAGLMPGASRPLSVSYVRGMLAIYRSVLAYGRAVGYDIVDFTEGLSVPRPFDDQPAARLREKRQPISIADCVTVASNLHVIHQIVFWLQRVVGLRVSEAYGIRVGDVVDVGDVGLLLVGRQGGRIFLQRNRSGRTSTTEKELPKTAAGRRTVVVPRQLLELIRAVIDTFHTDPLTGHPRIDARLVPGLARDGTGGQGAYRTALKGAARHCRSLDSRELELTTHHLRKSLSTTLAWSTEVSELAKRRHMGHNAGHDVFARVYTLDHPSLAPLLPVATLVEDEIEAATTTLMITTERRFDFGKGHPLRRRAQEIEAQLAELRWQVSGGDLDAVWLRAPAVAAELGLSVTYTRRLMASGFLPSVQTTDRFGNPQRRARLEDVLAVRSQIASTIILRDLAVELGTGYYPAYHTLRRLKITPAADPRTGQLTLSGDQAEQLRAEFARIRDLNRRAVKVSEACTRLGRSYQAVTALLRNGELELDPETDSSGHRFVTRHSLERLEGTMQAPTVGRVHDLLSLAEVRSVTGLSRNGVLALIRSGRWERLDIDDRLHVTEDSVARWAKAEHPDLLEALAARSVEGVNRCRGNSCIVPHSTEADEP